MPYPNEHAARLVDPREFDEFSRKNDAGGPGVHFIYGIKAGEATRIQAVRFDAQKFTPDEAKAWLKEHDMEPIQFEEAVTGDEGQKPANRHLAASLRPGMWMIDTRWVSHMQTGLAVAQSQRPVGRQENVAVIHLNGPLSKDGDWGTSTTQFRRDVCEAR
jgi:hypothetical protein